MGLIDWFLPWDFWFRFASSSFLIEINLFDNSTSMTLANWTSTAHFSNCSFNPSINISHVVASIFRHHLIESTSISHHRQKDHKIVLSSSEAESRTYQFLPESSSQASVIETVLILLATTMSLVLVLIRFVRKRKIFLHHPSMSMDGDMMMMTTTIAETIRKPLIRNGALLAERHPEST